MAADRRQKFLLGVGQDLVVALEFRGDGLAQIPVAPHPRVVGVGVDGVPGRVADEIGRDHIADGPSGEADRSEFCGEVAQVAACDDGIGEPRLSVARSVDGGPQALGQPGVVVRV